jgi:uncharacterized cupredoxin-like copper-binding protein
MRRVVIVAAVVLGVAMCSLPVAAARTGGTKKTTVKVTATEFKFKLSRAAVPKGKVIFKVKNAGKLQHDFKIAGKRTRLLAPGKSATLTVVFKKAGKYRYICTVPGHAAAGMNGKLRVK